MYHNEIPNFVISGELIQLSPASKYLSWED